MAEPALRLRAPVFTARFAPSTHLERRLISTLWSFRSTEWTGFIDFREPGIYFTHWGWGEWRTDTSHAGDDRTIRLQNGYDPFWFVLAFDDDLLSFRCLQSNHPSRPVGDMLFDYARQEPPAPFWQR